MQSRNGRGWIARTGATVLFFLFGALGSCDIEDPMGVGQQEVQAPHKTRASVSADSTGDSPEDECHLVDGQWVCN